MSESLPTSHDIYQSRPLGNSRRHGPRVPEAGRIPAQGVPRVAHATEHEAERKEGREAAAARAEAHFDQMREHRRVSASRKSANERDRDHGFQAASTCCGLLLALEGLSGCSLAPHREFAALTFTRPEPMSHQTSRPFGQEERRRYRVMTGGCLACLLVHSH